MKKILTLGVLTVLALGVVGCGNSMARNWGGTVNTTLPANKKLMNVTWKDSDLWFLVRDMKPGETAETYEFIEDSNMGWKSGKVIIKETK